MEKQCPECIKLNIENILRAKGYPRARKIMTVVCKVQCEAPRSFKLTNRYKSRQKIAQLTLKSFRHSRDNKITCTKPTVKSLTPAQLPGCAEFQTHKHVQIPPKIAQLTLKSLTHSHIQLVLGHPCYLYPLSSHHMPTR